MYLHRDIEQTLIKAAESFQVITLFGSRQVGKTTTVEQIFGNSFEFVSLDDIDELELAINNPKSFMDIHPWPLIIDEVQKAPGILNEIKKRVDEQRRLWLKNDSDRKLMYILTGSNQFELQDGISDSLAGRTAVLQLASMTQFEKNGCKGNAFHPNIEELIEKENKNNYKNLSISKIFESIFEGGMPDVVTGESDRNMYYKSYIDTYIEKDVRKLISASSELQFRKFLSILAFRTAQEINYADLSRNVGIDVETCKRWLSILETSGIIVLLEPYMANLSKRVIKTPKMYFMDTGICAYLCKWPNSEMLRGCAMSGAFFETYVISEIIKSFYNHAVNPKHYLYYYRDIDKKEVDLLYVENNAIYPVEIKKSEYPNKATKNFDVLKKYNMEIKPGLVISNTDKIRPINEKAYTFPISILGI